MILKDYKETYDPFLFYTYCNWLLTIFLIIPFNPLNRGSKKGLSYDSPASQLVLVVHL